MDLIIVTEKDGVKGVLKEENGRFMFKIVDENGTVHFAGSSDGPIASNPAHTKEYLERKIDEFLRDRSNFKPDYR